MCHCCAGIIPTSMGHLCWRRVTQNAGYTKWIGSQRKQNGTFKSVVQLCAKVITEIMEDRYFFTPSFQLHFLLSL